MRGRENLSKSSVPDFHHGQSDVGRHRPAIAVFRAVAAVKIFMGRKRRRTPGAGSTLLAGCSRRETPVQSCRRGLYRCRRHRPGKAGMDASGSIRQTAPFIPVPEIAVDPNSGTTIGLIPTWVSTDENHNVSRIIAPDIIYNPNFGLRRARAYFFLLLGR